MTFVSNMYQRNTHPPSCDSHTYCHL